MSNTNNMFTNPNPLSFNRSVHKPEDLSIKLCRRLKTILNQLYK